VNLETAATTIQSTRDLDEAAHPRSGLFDDREPQTRTSGISVPPAVKTIKDSGTVTFRDARAIIRHSQHQDVGIRPQEGELHDNPAIVIAIADRVVDEFCNTDFELQGWTVEDLRPGQWAFVAEKADKRLLIAIRSAEAAALRSVVAAGEGARLS